MIAKRLFGFGLLLGLSSAALFRGDCTFAQTLPVGKTSWQEALRAEASGLIAAGVSKPYGLGWMDGDAKQISYEAGATPAAGLALVLAGEVLGESQFEDAGVQVSRGMGLALDPAGRLPGTVLFGNGIGGREAPGVYAKRGPSFAGLGFVLYLDRRLKGQDARVAGTGTRLANWIIKGQKRPGVFPVGHKFVGESYPRQIVRWDTTDMRDGVLALLMVSKCAVGESLLPELAATRGAQQGVNAVMKGRILELGRVSRFLWPTASELDNELPVLKNVAEFPPAGHLLGTRYSMQALVAAYLATGDVTLLDAARQSAEAVGKLKTKEGWLLVDDPEGKLLPPPSAPAAPVEGSFVQAGKAGWPVGDWGLTATLATVRDVRAVGREGFNKMVGKRVSPELMYAALLTGLAEALPTADFPLSKMQVEDYVAGHPEVFGVLGTPPPAADAGDLKNRVRRLWALYWLARWEKELK